MILGKSNTERSVIRGRLIAGATAAMLAVAAGGGQASAQRQTPSFVVPQAPLPDTGKPQPFEAPPRLAEDAATEPRGCAPALPCDMRLFGTVRRGGGVELRAIPFSW